MIPPFFSSPIYNSTTAAPPPPHTAHRIPAVPACHQAAKRRAPSYCPMPKAWRRGWVYSTIGHHVRQGCGQQPCDLCVRFLCVRERNGPRVKLRHTHDTGVWSPCRGLRGGALPLGNRGGRRAERESRSTSFTRTRTARSSSGEVEQKPPSRSRRIVVAKVLRTWVRASSKDAFLCAQKTRACAERLR